MTAVDQRLPEPLLSLDRERPRFTIGRALLELMVLLVFVGIVVLRPGLSATTAFVDPMLAILGVVGLSSMMRIGSRSTRTLVRLLPWYWVFLVGSLIGLSHVGVTAWATTGMATTTLALLTFFVLWHLLDVDRLEGVATVGLVIATVVAMLGLLLDPRGYRADGWFLHANYAGHFGVAAGMILVLGFKRPALRLLGLASIVYTVQVTGSFGAIGMLLGMGAVVAWRTMSRNTAALTVGLIVIVIAAGAFLTAPEDDLPSTSAQEIDQSAGSLSGSGTKSAINQDRFDRSQDTRFEIWGQALSVWWHEPLGLGPNGVKNSDKVIFRGRAIEVHSDPIGVLVERGPIGVIGWLGMWCVIWLATQPYGLARVLLIGNWVQGLFRETLHYRHMWVLLALLMVLDQRKVERERAVGAVDEAPADRAAVATG